MSTDPVIDCPVHFYERHVATAPRTKVNPKTGGPRLHKAILIMRLFQHHDWDTNSDEIAGILLK